MRRSVVVAAILVAIALLLVGGPSLLVSPPSTVVVQDTGEDPRSEVVRPTGGESGFWPYLNARKSFEKRSPINVVVLGDTDEVIHLLTGPRGGEWVETDEKLEEAGPDTHTVLDGAGSGPRDAVVPPGPTDIEWVLTTGASRYAYVDPGGGGAGRWVEETAQVHDGTYYGHRYHVRLYESPNRDERWVAMQTHSEHFDWFTLRHRVHGTHEAQMRLEADLMALPQVDPRRDVARVYLGNGNLSDADGWATFVSLVGTVVAGFALGRPAPSGAHRRLVGAIDDLLTGDYRQRFETLRERVSGGHLALAGLVVLLVLGVRITGIALEQLGLLPMHAIAALLYPFVGVGLPVGTSLLAAQFERPIDAVVVTTGSLAAAIWFDYALIGVTWLPIDVVVQRMSVAVALGLIAGGAAGRSSSQSRLSEMLVVGSVLWLVVLSATLFGFL